MNTFKLSRTFFQFSACLLAFSGMILLSSCENDDEGMMPTPDPTGDSKTYTLSSVSDPNISGTAKFEELEGGSALVTLTLSGTSGSTMHPAHIHLNSAAIGGDIAISLNPVDAATGMSETQVSEMDNGTAITYDQLLDFDGYINVHASESDLATLVAQGDIGSNELTGDSKTYTLVEKAVEGISGSVKFEERTNGFTLATIMLENTPDDGSHPAHIHMNSAVEGGGIAITFNPVNGATGMSKTGIRGFNGEDGTMNAGEAISYEEILEYNGYVNVHLSADDLGTLVAQGDIGSNELTGETKEYALNTKDVEGISGTATFAMRKDGSTLLTLALEGSAEGADHPAHIHMNSAVESGAIAISLNSVDASDGMSMTSVRAFNGEDGTMNAGEAISYEELLEYDGYINVHKSVEDLGTLLAQGDIGGNELTGESKAYALEERAVPGISGEVMFEERKNGTTLATIMLENTPDGGMHPAHIHMNSAAEGGGIAITFNTVDGSTGMSKTNIRAFNGEDGTMNAGEVITYEEILEYNGYVNVHLSAADLATLVAQGDIGSNELTGETKVYTLNTRDVEGVSGTATFAMRKDGSTLVTLALEGTTVGGNHPSHIHMNSATEGGDIAISLNNVVGDTGMSMTSVRAFNAEDGTMNGGEDISYEELLAYDGYINVHLSMEDLATLVAQGDIGSNAP